MATATAEKQELAVMFNNETFPWLVVMQPLQKGQDPAERDMIRFNNGTFVATEQWQIDLLERDPNAHRNDMADPMRCPYCEWSSKSSQAFQTHIKLRH